MTTIFVLGGVRSGKSELAVRLAAASPDPVVFVATMQHSDDAEVEQRIANHRAGRPAGWRTVEAPSRIADALRDGGFRRATVIVDCLTLWASNLLVAADTAREMGDTSPEALAVCARRFEEEIAALFAWAEEHQATLIVVSNEVGAGVVPPYALGRAFRDLLGTANAMVAGRADRVYYVVAGLVIDLRAVGALPVRSFTPLSAS
jgi:adenosylcobinamide kinase/adenosylcobinamide-phosphate guanylyltransferase